MVLRTDWFKQCIFLLLNLFVVFRFPFQGVILTFTETGYLSISVMFFIILAIFVKNKRINLDFIFRTGLLRRDFLSAFTLYSVFMLFVLLATVAHGEHSYEMLRSGLHVYAAAGMSLLVPLLFFCSLFLENATFENYVKSLLLATSIHFTSFLLLNLLPTIKIWWIDSIVAHGVNHHNFNIYYFRVAFDGMIGDATSRITGLHFILGSYCLVSKRCMRSTGWRFVILLVISAISTLFYARIGFFSVVCGVLVLMRDKKVFRKFSFSAIIATALAGGLLVVFPGLSRVYRWMFEVFISFLQSGKLSSGSTQEILSWFHFPPFNVLLFGGGSFVYTSDLGDSGIMRSIYYFGILGLLFEFICVYGFYRIAFKSFSDKNDSNGEFVCKLLLMLYFVWEIKLPSTANFVVYFLLLYWLNNIENFFSVKSSFCKEEYVQFAIDY